MASNHTLAVRLSEKEFAYRTGVSFRGLTISQTETGWNVVVRGFSREGAPVYSLVQHTDAVTALEILVQSLSGRDGPALWHKDKFYRGNGSS